MPPDKRSGGGGETRGGKGQVVDGVAGNKGLLELECLPGDGDVDEGEKEDQDSNEGFVVQVSI